MTVALGLLFAAALVGLTGPLYLRRTVSPRVRPGLALSGWVVSLLLVAGCAVAGAVLLAVPQHAAVDSLIGMARACVNSGEFVWETIVRLTGITLVVGTLIHTLVVAARIRGRHAAHRDTHLSLVRIIAQPDPADRSLLWLPENTPVAYSMGGHRGGIVATTGVGELTAPAQTAVLAHERAHLRGRHHRLVLLAETLRRALPFVPLFRAASPAIRVLVELSADAAAVRHCGAAGVQAALYSTGKAMAPPPSLAMSRDAVELRLQWLQMAGGEATGAMRRATRYGSAVLASLTPALLSLGVVAGLVVALCTAFGPTAM